MTCQSVQYFIMQYSMHTHSNQFICTAYVFGPNSLEFQFAIVLIEDNKQQHQQETKNKNNSQCNTQMLQELCKETFICLLIHSSAQSNGLIHDESTYQTTQHTNERAFNSTNPAHMTHTNESNKKRRLRKNNTEEHIGRSRNNTDTPRDGGQRRECECVCVRERKVFS